MANPGNRYARGSKAYGICQKCGLRDLLNNLTYDGQVPWLRVHPACFDMRHPQERMVRVTDPIALWHPSPEAEYTYPVLSVEASVGSSIDFDVAVAFDGSNAYGYDFESFGVISTEPALIDDAQLIVVEALGASSGFEIFILNALLPEEYTTLRVETASGTVDLDLTAPDDGYTDPAESWYWWDTDAIWGAGDVGQVRTISFISNAAANSLTWTAAQFWNGRVESYQLYRSVNGGAYSLLAGQDVTYTMFGAIETEPLDWSDTPLTPGAVYAYRVDAMDVYDRALSSNIVTITAV